MSGIHNCSVLYDSKVDESIVVICDVEQQTLWTRNLNCFYFKFFIRIYFCVVSVDKKCFMKNNLMKLVKKNPMTEMPKNRSWFFCDLILKNKILSSSWEYWKIDKLQWKLNEVQKYFFNFFTKKWMKLFFLSKLNTIFYTLNYGSLKYFFFTFCNFI